MLISPIAFVLLALSFLGRPPLVTADTLERLQCWCRKRASHHDAHNDASYLRAVYHNKLLRYPLTVEHECTHGLCVGIIGEPPLRHEWCTMDRAKVNRFCYFKHLIDTDSISVNGEERAVHNGQRQESPCEQICRRKFGLPVSGGPFAPESRLEVFVMDDMDQFVKKVD